MIRLQCKNCGHIQNYLKSDLVKDDICDLCGGKMIVSKKEITNIVKQDSIERMEEQIYQLGHKRVWEIIERFNNVKTRLGYRRIFLDAGGIIPKSEV